MRRILGRGTGRARESYPLRHFFESPARNSGAFLHLYILYQFSYVRGERYRLFT